MLRNGLNGPPLMKIAPFSMFMIADLVFLLELGQMACFITLLKTGFLASHITFEDPKVFLMLSCMLSTRVFSWLRG